MKVFSKIRYRYKIALVISIFALLPSLVFGIFVVKRQWDDKVNTVLNESGNRLKSDTEAVNAILLSSMQKLVFINTNSSIVTYLKNGNYTDLTYTFTEYDYFKKQIQALSIGTPGISIMIYPLDNEAFNGYYIEKVDLLENRLKSKYPDFLKTLMALDWDGYLWLYEADDQDGSNLTGTIHCFSKMQSIGKTVAITEFSINIKNVMKCIHGEYPPGSIIAYRPGNLADSVEVQCGELSKGDYQLTTDVDLHKQNAGKYYQIGLPLNYSPGAFTLFVARTYIESSLKGFFWVSIAEVVLVLAFLFFTIEVISYFLTRRLSKLIDSVNSDIGNIEIGNIDIRSSEDKSREDDIAKMEHKFYDMLGRIQNYYQSAITYENEKKSLELELLQSRINPHFLYNTLSAFRWNSNNSKMTEIIDSMVSYYRLALGKGDMIINIADETKLSEEYLKIQKYTYESDFEYFIDIQDEVKKSLIVKNLLQPLVENAVLHGILGMKSGGVIRLSGKCEDGAVLLEISDNGMGMAPETVKKLLEGEYKGQIGGYGIRNVQKRMSLFYGADSSLQIISEPKKGTTVVIKVPAMRPDTLPNPA